MLIIIIILSFDTRGRENRDGSELGEWDLL